DPYEYFFGPYMYKEGDTVAYMKLGGGDYVYFFLDWYQIPKMLGKPAWTEPYFDEAGGNIIMSTFSTPFYKRVNGQRILNGIVTVDIDLSWLKNVIDSINIIRSGYAFLISKRGVFISHPADSLVMNESIFSLASEKNDPYLREIGKKMIAGETGFINFNPFSEEEAWMYFTQLPASQWSLGIIFPEKELFADLNAQFKTMIFLGIAGIILTIIIITTISKKITQPLVKLANLAGQIGVGNFDIQLPAVRGTDEIDQLNQSFGLMRTELKNYILNLQVTTAAKNKMESELKIAHDIQQGIIPKTFPPFPERSDLDLYAILEPAREVGGDLYDFFFVDDTHLVFAVGDVSGKGVPASLFMAITRTLLRAKTTPRSKAHHIIASINRELCKDNINAMFVTFFLGILDLETGFVEYCNAGHNHPYILRKNTIPELIEKTHGPPIGLFDDINYQSASAKLSKGDTIVLYTDGIPEAMNANGDFLGEKAFVSILEKLCSGCTPKNITNQLLAETKTFAGSAEPSDDITILVLTYYLES
ncbi:MAG: SpoIIE family protein phosphatase, partial [Bacteroidales bacterium]|nr:SpoIIE family protein phosphatase [Bacteroidales bacterium]